MNPTNDSQGPKPLQSLSHGLHLLKILNESDHAMGLADISGALQMSKSGAYRLLVTLEQHGFVRQDPATGKYGLTQQLWEMGARTISRLVLHQAASPHMEHLANSVGQPVYLAILVDRFDTLAIDRASGSKGTTLVSNLTVRAPWHASASGKCMIAFAPRHLKERALHMPSLCQPPLTLANVSEMRRELESIRAQGYGENHNEHAIGTDALAAPILDDAGTAAASIGVFWPSGLYTQSQYRNAVAQMLTAVNDISCDLIPLIKENARIKR